MKMISRFGGSLIVLILIGFSIIYFFKKNTVSKDGKLEIIDSLFLKSTPIASIINLPRFTLASDSFTLNSDSKIHVYGVGELIYNLSSGPSADFFKGDNIALYLGCDSTGKKTNCLEFDWADLAGKSGYLNNKNADFVGWQYSDSMRNYNTPEIIGKYYAKIRIPFERLKELNAITDSGILLNIVVGNADDEFRIRSKTSFSNSLNPSDPSSLKFIRLSRNVIFRPDTILHDTVIHAEFSNIILDSSIDKDWMRTTSYKISNIIYGVIKGKYDFEAKVNFLWDKKYLFLCFDIQDAHRQNKDRIDMSKRQTFLDYGWIEDENRSRVWEMNAVYSKHAGGAFKNHYVDTSLFLKKGKYYVFFNSDESHGYDDWDDDAPLTSFYGIKIFK